MNDILGSRKSATELWKTGVHDEIRDDGRFAERDLINFVETEHKLED